MKLSQSASQTESRVEMIPLIDVVFLVLVAFIYASMFMTHKTGLPVDLPEASQTQSEMSEVMTLTIMRDGSLFLNEISVSLENLGEKLSDAKTVLGDDVVLYVLADRKAQLDPLVKVMDLARKAGITGLTIAAEQHADPASRP